MSLVGTRLAPLRGNPLDTHSSYIHVLWPKSSMGLPMFGVLSGVVPGLSKRYNVDMLRCVNIRRSWHHSRLQRFYSAGP